MTSTVWDMTPPLVSIIVPSYNHERYLERRLASIAAQTYAPIEVFLLDDASTDGSQKRLSAFASKHQATLLFNTSNSGSPFAQWNKGAQLATGELLWFAESDDFCEPSFLQKLVPYFRNDPLVGLAYCRSWRVGEDDSRQDLVPAHEAPSDPQKFERDFIGWGPDEIKDHLCVQSTIPNASAVLVRRQAFLDAGGAPTHMKLCGDWLAWLKVLCACKLAYHAEPLNSFRAPHIHSQRLSYQKKASRIREWVEVQHFLRDHMLLDSPQVTRTKDYLAQMTLESVLFWATKGKVPDALACLQAAHELDALCIPRGAWLILKKLLKGNRA